MTTGPSRELYQRRDEDGGRFARARAWWTRNWSIIAGVWLVCLSAWVVWVSLEIRASEQESNLAAKVQCERSMQLGPSLADYYASDPFFPREVLRVYRQTLPKTCPK